MCRRNRRGTITGCVLASTSRTAQVASLIFAWAFATPARADDELVPFLERLHLTRLLVEHLERELKSGAIGDSRQHIVDQLTDAYPELLEREDDPTRREELVRRSSVLLEKEGPRRGENLRLALLRARYRTASRTGEDHRAALDDDASAAQAVATLAAVAESAKDLRARLDQRIKDLERKGDRTGGLEGDKIVDRADQLRGMGQEALGLEAWSNYYRSVLTDDRAFAESAQNLFARVIDTGDSFPNPKDVSLDLRSNEFFANALLGMALAKARTESIGAANEWLNLLDNDRAPSAMRKQLPAWRIAIAVDRGEWATARELLRAASADRESPTAWLRLAAVGGLRGPANNPAAISLAREAIAALASRRELAQVADLARRFGDRALGESGFAARYVRGITAYERARAANASSKNATTDRTAALDAYREAGEHFEGAMKASDAAQFESAIASCRTLAGWCRFERGDFAGALVLFTDAASADAREEEPEWMALVSLEKMLGSASDDKKKEIEKELRSRVDGFIARHPSSPKIPELLVRRMVLADVPRREDLERLLAMDDAAVGAAAAKRQAVLGLYKLFHESRGPERAASGKRFLEAMRKLAASGSKPLEGLPAGDASIARQALEIALSQDVADADTAEPILAAFDRLIAAKAIDASSFQSELLLRWVQLALVRDRLIDALVRLDALERRTGDGADRAIELGRRHVFRYSAARLRDPALSTGTADRGAVLGACVRSGDALLRVSANAAGSLEKSLDDPVTEGVAFAVAQAVAESSQSAVNADAVARGLVLGKALLARKPKDPIVLETLASIAIASGEKSLAAECLRQLVTGSSVASDRWYRAKVSLIELLADIDPTRARAVLAQHVKLQPDYGPPPFAERLRSVERKLKSLPDDAPAAVPSTTETPEPSSVGSPGGTP